MEDIWMTNELHGASVFSSCNSNFQLIGFSFEALHLCMGKRRQYGFLTQGGANLLNLKHFKPKKYVKKKESRQANVQEAALFKT